MDGWIVAAVLYVIGFLGGLHYVRRSGNGGLLAGDLSNTLGL